MKKLINLSGIYGLLALISGVFYREFTKAYNYTGHTTLSVAHVHLMALGALLFLILTLYARDTCIMDTGKFKKIMIFYNIGLPFAVIMFYVRGIIQIKDMVIPSGINYMISGLAGVSHLMIAIGLFFLFGALKESVSEGK